jgi:hypothetical protein
MGNNWKNSEKSKEDVENDILIINQITRNYLFMKKTKLYMFFDISVFVKSTVFSNVIKSSLSIPIVITPVLSSSSILVRYGFPPLVFSVSSHSVDK